MTGRHRFLHVAHSLRGLVAKFTECVPFIRICVGPSPLRRRVVLKALPLAQLVHSGAHLKLSRYLKSKIVAVQFVNEF
jgi:hypothetical protein